jgi:hypothetical protein
MHPPSPPHPGRLLLLGSACVDLSQGLKLRRGRVAPLKVASPVLPRRQLAANHAGKVGSRGVGSFGGLLEGLGPEAGSGGGSRAGWELEGVETSWASVLRGVSQAAGKTSGSSARISPGSVQRRGRGGYRAPLRSVGRW